METKNKRIKKNYSGIGKIIKKSPTPFSLRLLGVGLGCQLASWLVAVGDRTLQIVDCVDDQGPVLEEPACLVTYDLIGGSYTKPFRLSLSGSPKRNRFGEQAIDVSKPHVVIGDDLSRLRSVHSELVSSGLRDERTETGQLLGQRAFVAVVGQIQLSVVVPGRDCVEERNESRQRVSHRHCRSNVLLEYPEFRKDFLDPRAQNVDCSS